MNTVVARAWFRLDSIPGSAYDSVSPRRPALTRALEEAFREASKLTETEQNALAAAIRAELDAEWDESLNDSQDTLAKLADEAFNEFQSGQTQPLQPKKR